MHLTPFDNDNDALAEPMWVSVVACLSWLTVTFGLLFIWWVFA